MRILSVLKYGHLPQLMGGTQSVVHDLSLMLRQDNHQSAVVATILPSGPLYLKNRIKARLFPRSPCPDDRSLGYPVYRGWNSLDCIAKVRDSFAPDIAIMHGGWSPGEASRVCDLGLPTILYFHDTYFVETSSSWPSTPLLRCVANSRFTAGRVEQAFGIPCPIVLPITRLSNYKLALKPKFVTMINPNRQKGVHTALEVARARPDIQFLFVRAWQSLNPTEDREITAILERFSNVIISRSVLDMRKVFRRTKILIMPSQWDEPWGRAGVEAQVSGIPVIARDVGGLSEAIGDGGILLPRDAPASTWVEAVSLLWDSERAYQDASNRAVENATRVANDISISYDLLVSLCRQHSMTSEVFGL